MSRRSFFDPPRLNHKSGFLSLGTKLTLNVSHFSMRSTSFHHQILSGGIGVVGSYTTGNEVVLTMMLSPCWARLVNWRSRHILVRRRASKWWTFAWLLVFIWPRKTCLASGFLKKGKEEGLLNFYFKMAAIFYKYQNIHCFFYCSNTQYINEIFWSRHLDCFSWDRLK